MAPSRPLVSQQLRACRDMLSLPSNQCVLLEGSVSPSVRADIWQSTETRLVFCTPQTALHDLIEGRLEAHSVVCVVIDEAHKATSRYAYTGFVEELSRHSEKFRVLALSATPGANVKKIQNVVHNLHIAHIEVRTEQDEDVVGYIKKKNIEVVKYSTASCAKSTSTKSIESPLLVSPPISFCLLTLDQFCVSSIKMAKDLLLQAMDPPLQVSRAHKIIFCSDPLFLCVSMIEQVLRYY
jgi:ERCC4-related helicase